MGILILTASLVRVRDPRKRFLRMMPDSWQVNMGICQYLELTVQHRECHPFRQQTSLSPDIV